MIFLTESIGTAKLNPSAAITFIKFTPTTSPSILTRGPPEFPYITDRNNYKYISTEDSKNT